ncbi:AMMECR1-domain protein [Methanobacterium lacus]|uniref:Protein Metbo_1963 n=1 Tax=Methanobacterium lacus (strain AL-21) TaxID=877455 RepID=F0TB37_METLA|nr:TIGR00296 family protein [Methanobacterium lacus]ADZ10183.1 AMMECR1-domain protein [Methanobacterium lacus]
MLSEEQGQFLLKLAREAITVYLKEGRVIPIPETTDTIMHENRGVFVTLNKENCLRGCIGYPEPVMPLINAVVDAAISAAVRDPRFNCVTLEELETIELELSVLTKPELIPVDDPTEYLDNIIIGEDGLIVESGPYRGLLLPQVATEWGWNKEEFLSNTCNKAGLNSECWLSGDVKIYKFSSEIFEEDLKPK